MDSTILVPAEQLDANDIIDSHDGESHDIASLSIVGDVVSVNVRVRGTGHTYSADFDAKQLVRVVA